MGKTIDILGYPHAYELTAPRHTAPVLVFVHGWLLSRAYWRPVIQRLEAQYQCLSYDLRGFGASQPANKAVASPNVQRDPVAIGVGRSGSPPSIRTLPLASSYSPAAYAADLNQLLQELNIPRAWIIGHSLGGTIALWTADQSPERVTGVICINSGGGIYVKEEFERFRTVGQQLVKFRPGWLSYLPGLDWALARMNVAQPVDLAWGQQRLLDLLNAQSDAAMGALLESTTEEEVHLLPQVVARLHQPVHFIAGANDSIMEPKYVHHLASFHRSFESCGYNVTEIPHSGHLLMVEQPDALVHQIQTIMAEVQI